MRSSFFIFMCIGMFLFSSIAAVAQGSGIKVGEEVSISNKTWSVVEAENKVIGVFNHTHPGDTCWIVAGGHAKVVKILSEYGIVLEYSRSWSLSGNECPSGTRFSVTKRWFDEAVKIENELAAREEMVKN